MKSILAFLCILLCAGAAVCETLNSALEPYGVFFPKSNFSVTKNQKLSGHMKNQHVIEARTKGDEFVQIRVIGPIQPNDAKNLLGGERTAIEKLYGTEQTPYMGDIAAAIGGCPSYLGPVPKSFRFHGQEVDTVSGAVGTDRSFGACSLTQAKYRGAVVTYYNPDTKMVWIWRVYSPWRDGRNALSSDWLTEFMSQFQDPRLP